MNDLDETDPFEGIDCASATSDWKETAIEKVRASIPFQLINVPLRESGPVESAADRRYHINIIGYNSATGIAEAIQFVPWPLGQDGSDPENGPGAKDGSHNYE